MSASMINVRRASLCPPERGADLPPPQDVTGGADAPLIAVTLLLTVFGVVMVYSASAVFAARVHHDAQFFLVRQGLYALVGAAAMAFVASLDHRRLRALSYPVLLGTFGLMAAVPFLGHRVNGAVRWIRLGPVNLQPSELAKIALVAWLAHSLSKKQEKIRTFSVGFLPHLLVAMLLMGLCLQQRDMGSAVVLLALTFTLLFVAGARLGYIMLAGLLAAPAAVWLVKGTNYRHQRWLAFTNPFDPQYRRGISYQLVESLLGFGAGGTTGVGLGDSRQKLFYLPEAHTDFISAIIGEELGFVGVAALIAAYGVMVWRGVVIASRSRDDHGTYLAFGMTTLLAIQALINLGVAMGQLPTKGLTLPFISYGGSSLIVDLVAVGVLLSVSRSAAASR
ncbi:MAG: putative lipid II flippase FtsW [Polyangiales bacterium]